MLLFPYKSAMDFASTVGAGSDYYNESYFYPTINLRTLLIDYIMNELNQESTLKSILFKTRNF